MVKLLGDRKLGLLPTCAGGRKQWRKVTASFRSSGFACSDTCLRRQSQKSCFMVKLSAVIKIIVSE